MINFKEFKKINEKASTEDMIDALYAGLEDSKFVEAMYDWFAKNYPDAPLYAGDAVPDDYIELLDNEGDSKMINKIYKDLSKKFSKSMNEAKIPTPSMVKKNLKSLNFDMIHPEFFDVEKKNTDAGMGGYDYIQINFDAKDATSPKRASDVKLALMSISSKWKNAKVDTKAGTIIISEAAGDTKFHKYSKNTLEELELLLKHHKEDLAEYKEEDECSKESIEHDIEEVQAAIDALRTNEAKEEINYKNLVRYIPTGSRVKTILGAKSLKIMIINPISAPPLTTKDIPNAEKRLLKDVDSFVDDVESVVKIKKVDKGTYVFIKGVDNGIELIYEFTINVGSAAEGKKLAKLDEAMVFYK